MFLEVVGLERAALSLVSANEELLERKKSSGSGLENRYYERRGLVYGTPIYPQKLVLTSSTNGGG
jgi:hypothetical protein